MVPEASRGGQMSPRNPRIGREASPPTSCSQPRTQMSPGGTALAGFPGRLQGCVPGQRAVTVPLPPPPAAGCCGLERSVGQKAGCGPRT